MNLHKLSEEEVLFFATHGYEFEYQDLRFGIPVETKDYLTKRILENVNKCGLEGYEEIKGVSIV